MDLKLKTKVYGQIIQPQTEHSKVKAILSTSKNSIMSYGYTVDDFLRIEINGSKSYDVTVKVNRKNTFKYKNVNRDSGQDFKYDLIDDLKSLLTEEELVYNITLNFEMVKYKRVKINGRN